MRMRTPRWRAASTKPAAALAREGGLLDLLVDHAGVEVVVLLVSLGELGVGRLGRECAPVPVPVPVPVAVAVLLPGPLVGGDQLGEHAREGVDLVPAQIRSRGGRGSRRCEHALEPEHQPVADAPAIRRRAPARVHLDERLVERAAAGGAGRQRDDGILTRVEKGLAVPGLSAERGGLQAFCGLRR